MMNIFKIVVDDIRQHRQIDGYVAFIVTLSVSIISFFSKAVSQFGISLLLTANAIIIAYILALRHDILQGKKNLDNFTEWPPEFPHFSGKTESIRAVGVTHSRFVRDNFEIFKEALETNKNFSLSVILRDPDGKTLELVCKNSAETLTLESIRTQIEASISRIKDLKRIASQRVHCYTIDHPTPVGIYEVKRKGDGAPMIFVEYHGYKSRSKVQPRLTINESHPLYAHYKNQIERYFENATKIN